MISGWRLDKAKRSQGESFSGDGAQLAGGRWNRRGVRAVYLSESLALAALERFVHTQEEGRQVALVSYKVEIPSSVKVDRPNLEDLPKNWKLQPAPVEVQDFGTAWLKKGARAVLLVPSAVVPSERNLLLNPEHEDFRKIRVGSRIPFTIDPRMWK
ncbi:MAG TPA: RES family NAD+ phosphorylase [Elusimicrobiota bacterium]|nr:RES family NAD+ phosphorylase [Elusimicrobiota bacterium]